MTTYAALTNTVHHVKYTEIERDSRVIAEMIDYIRWLADQDALTKLTAADVWSLYYEGVRRGRHWSEVCEDLKLPVRTDW